MTAEREGLAEEDVAIMARWLHDDVGGCCVERIHACVFGGDGARKEASDLLTTGALADLLAARDRRVRGEAVELGRISSRFWRKVEVGSPNECWPWTGATLGFGHGRFDSPAGQTAHRAAWAIAHAELPPAGSVVRHRCDNPPCCNPKHLVIGSQADNVADMVDRGRSFWDEEVCKRGHERTPANTILKADGTRGCRTCQRAQERERRQRAPKYVCSTCGDSMLATSAVRHMRNRHGEETTYADLRDRADRIEAEG